MGETACLILDLKMPGIDGLELRRRLVEESNPVPIVFLSAQASADDEHEALRAGVVQFLQKPVSNQVLLAAIRDAMTPPPLGEKNRYE